MFTSSRRLALVALALTSLGLSAALAQAPVAPPQAAAGQPAGTAPMPVVASFSILGDMVQEIGGERIALTTLVGPGGDAHVYSPTPADAKAIAGARLVFTNGLKFEGWIGRLVRAAGASARVVEAAQGFTPLRDPHHGHGHSHSHGHGHHHHSHGEFDPHAWQSVPNAKAYARTIAGALIAADPEGRTVYEARLARYLEELDALDRDLRKAVASLPADRRKIITSHDAFRYFEREYGLRFVGARGISTDSEPSAREVARLITQIKREKAPAVFVESISDPRLMERIARETGARIGGTLFSDALSPPDGPAPSYIRMMRHNMETIVAAFRPTN